MPTYVKYLMLNLTKCVLAAEMFALIYWKALDVRKASHTLNGVGSGEEGDGPPSPIGLLDENAE